MRKSQSSKRKLLIAKRAILVCLLVFCCVAEVFAANESATAAANGVNARMATIVNFFNNGWVKGIACIALIAECLGLLLGGGQNPQILKKFLPLIAGTILFMCAGKIINIFMGDLETGDSFSKDLNMQVGKD